MGRREQAGKTPSRSPWNILVAAAAAAGWSAWGPAVVGRIRAGVTPQPGSRQSSEYEQSRQRGNAGSSG